jgi:putative membrane protein
MSRTTTSIFTRDDLNRITASVREAERKTSGEIVPFIVDQSDPYEEAEWRCGCLMAVIALGVMSALHTFTLSWLPIDMAELALVTLSAGIAGVAAATYVPVVKRIFAGNHLIERRVAQRAAQAFLSEEVFKTRDRTGILLFISILEHRVLVLGDAGINAKVEHSDWEDVVQTVVRGIRSDRPADGIVDAIGRCGNLLERHGVARRPDDTDELSDEARLRPR